MNDAFVRVSSGVLIRLDSIDAIVDDECAVLVNGKWLDSDQECVNEIVSKLNVK